MKQRSLLLLRLSLGLLMVVWGVDKLVNVEHGMAVSAGFYLNLFSVPVLLQAFGVVQVLIGLLIGAGLARRFAYPALLAITATTLAGVWKSIVDPWGWYLEDANVLFHPSLIIFAASLVVWGFRYDDTLWVEGGTRGWGVH